MTHRAEPLHRAVRWVALAALAFTAASYAVPHVSQGLRAAYAPLCHQLAERSIEVAGVTQAVCARCAGLYLGGTAALFAAPLVLGRRRRLALGWLVAACAPTAVDALLPWVGLPQLSIWPRLVVALPAGFAAGLFLAIGVDGVARELGAPTVFHEIPHPPVEDPDVQ